MQRQRAVADGVKRCLTKRGVFSSILPAHISKITKPLRVIPPRTFTTLAPRVSVTTASVPEESPDSVPQPRPQPSESASNEFETRDRKHPDDSEGPLTEGLKDLAARARTAGFNFILDQPVTRYPISPHPTLTVEELLAAPKPWVEALDQCDQPTIYRAIQHLRGRSNSFEKVLTFLEYALRSRPKRLTRWHFNIVLEAMAHPKGSAKVVRTVLREMGEVGIEPQQLNYHNALGALAIHPDYVLRNWILNEMRSRWMEPTVLDKIFVAIGLLRDTQYELAMDYLDELIANHAFIAPWVFEIFSVVFGNLGFYDEAWQVTYQRLKPSLTAPSGDFILHMLTVFAEGFHYDGVRGMWYHAKIMGINVPDSVVQGVIHTGSRYGDCKMILEACDVLAIRGHPLGLAQLEPLLDAYVAMHDMSTAARILAVMHRSKLPVSKGSTRILYMTLRDNPELIPRFVEVIKGKDRQLPIAAVNVVMEVYHAHRDLKNAMKTYQHIADFTNDATTSETLAYLIDLAASPKSLTWLASEATIVLPDLHVKTTLLHKLVHACIITDSLDLALHYFHRIHAAWRSQAPKDQLIPMKEAYRTSFSGIYRALLAKRDKRCVEVLVMGHKRMQQLATGLRREAEGWEEIKWVFEKDWEELRKGMETGWVGWDEMAELKRGVNMEGVVKVPEGELEVASEGTEVTEDKEKVGATGLKNVRRRVEIM